MTGMDILNMVLSGKQPWPIFQICCFQGETRSEGGELTQLPGYRRWTDNQNYLYWPSMCTHTRKHAITLLPVFITEQTTDNSDNSNMAQTITICIAYSLTWCRVQRWPSICYFERWIMQSYSATADEFKNNYMKLKMSRTGPPWVANNSSS